jgi:hypothetical protein
MGMKPELSSQVISRTDAFAEPIARKPLVILRDTERSLRQRTITALVPVLPEELAENLGEASLVADESLEKLAAIDLDEITDSELQPARIKVGLVFVGFGALMMVFLLLYLNTLHPELSPLAQIQHYWYQYIWFVSLGVAGLFMLGREAMRV